MFGQFLCPSSGVFHCTQSNVVCPSWSFSQADSKPVWHIPLLYIQWKTPNDGQRNCPKHVEFYSKNKFDKLVNLVCCNLNTNPTGATVCRYLFTAKLLYLFRVSQHPSSGVLKTVPAASGTGHTTCTATPLQRPDQTTLEGSSRTSSMTCTGGCGYSF